MIDVMKAENYKFIHSATWKISLLICTIFSLFIILATPTNDWKKELLDYNEAIEQNVDMTAKEIQSSDDTNNQINQWKVNNTYLNTDARPATSDTFQGYMSTLLSLKILGLVLVVFPILFAVQIAKEYETGTVKYMLISPHSRIQLIIGKYVTVLVATLLFLLTIFIINLFLSYFLLEHSSSLFLQMSQNRVISTNIYAFMLKNNLLALVYYLIYLTFAFMLAVLTRSTTVSLSLALFFALLGTQLIGLLSLPNRILPFFFMSIVDLAHIENSLSLVEQNSYSLLSCLGIIAIYLIIFLVITLESFKRQNI